MAGLTDERRMEGDGLQFKGVEQKRPPTEVRSQIYDQRFLPINILVIMYYRKNVISY